MTELVATTPGLYPLPDWAKQRLSELKGHQKGDLISGDEGPEIVDAYEQAREEVVADQRDANLDRVVEGQLRWDDNLAHPLTVHDSVETGGIVRYYDNNNFYRDPRVVDELGFSGDVAAELEAASELLDGDDSLQAVLPGPYSLSDLATDEHYGDEAAFLDAVAEFLAGEVEAFPEHETLFLLEPSLVENAPGDGLDARASEAVDAVAAATDADVVVHSYWGALEEKVYAHLMDADVDAIGFDVVSGDRDQTLYNVNEYGTKDSVALGLVDGQNTLVESPETVRDRIEWVQDQIPAQEFDAVYATSNTELFYLPVNKYREKLTALAEGVALARGEETEVQA
ncbi:5-methyltetrahydropteroyltriglutamate--homocysteine methyltransferase [Haloprofundus sp. MHR1]|uniref:5-methyltetrahydropteroyltriglutamate-- homocysteine methyltransferase n=1 Tax=Haloprofundus sp. MHR1 TaxID=2572921 RepID=UPI0010BED2BF|nr:5-methyltetrahydropteroyltriglutamate--homocysteine methyltransferase [Haloprofundus sp. MHR1]QCJ46547.1 5-methyltetrahydropteroyltriglutamate--homocysteine methyltransferase [Haloprofundus sp. MHR1]